MGTSSSLHDSSSSLESSIPRPEYPRPQFARDEWLNLNGWWKFRIDDQNTGLEQRWFCARDYPAEILVPFSLESAMSGIGDPSFHPCVWYQRGIEVPVEWADRRIRLNFGAVDYRATVWVNDIVVAWHEGGHTPFSCDITGALLPSGNVLVVRAEDPPTDRYIPRGKQHWEAAPPVSSTRAPRAFGRRCGWSRWQSAIWRPCGSHPVWMVTFPSPLRSPRPAKRSTYKFRSFRKAALWLRR